MITIMQIEGGRGAKFQGYENPKACTRGQPSLENV